MKKASRIGWGHVSVGRAFNVRTFLFHFYDDGKILYKALGDKDFLEWNAEPVLLDTLWIHDFDLFDKYFNAWDD